MLGLYGTLLNGSTYNLQELLISSSQLTFILYCQLFTLFYEALKLQSFSIDE
jgi:hypothetical protein